MTDCIHAGSRCPGKAPRRCTCGCLRCNSARCSHCDGFGRIMRDPDWPLDEPVCDRCGGVGRVEVSHE